MAEVSTRGAADRAVVTTEGGRKDSQPMHLWRIVRQWPIVPFIIFGFLVTGAIFAPLIAMTLILGIYPSLVTDIIGPSVGALVADYEAAQPAEGLALKEGTTE